MGWMEHNVKILWGDTPQDEVDNAIKKATNDMDWQERDKLPRRRRMAIMRKLLADARLRHAVDGAFIEEWNRRASDQEFEYHIKVGLGLR